MKREAELVIRPVGHLWDWRLGFQLMTVYVTDGLTYESLDSAELIAHSSAHSLGITITHTEGLE